MKRTLLLGLPLAAVTLMPLAGFAPLLPLAGVIVSWTVLALAECEPLPEPPPDVLPEPDWQAAASRPAAPSATKGSSLRRPDRLCSCSTPSSLRVRKSSDSPCGVPARFPSMPGVLAC